MFQNENYSNINFPTFPASYYHGASHSNYTNQFSTFPPHVQQQQHHHHHQNPLNNKSNYRGGGGESSTSSSNVPNQEIQEQQQQQYLNQGLINFSVPDIMDYDMNRMGNVNRINVPSHGNQNQNSGINNRNPNGIGCLNPDDSGLALNNQVPPGNRANNYWDNFRR